MAIVKIEKINISEGDPEKKICTKSPSYFTVSKKKIINNGLPECIREFEIRSKETNKYVVVSIFIVLLCLKIVTDVKTRLASLY